MEKRYLWSRVRALILDILLAGVAFGLVVTVLHYTISKRIIPPEIFHFSRCQQAQLVSPERINELLPLREGEQHVQQVCDIYPLFMTHYRIGNLVRYKIVDNQIQSHELSYYADDAGNETTYFFTGPIFQILLPFLLAFWASRLGDTPGKRLVDLRVLKTDGSSASFRQFVTRECGRFLPVMILGLSSLVSSLFFPEPDLNASARMMTDMLAEHNDDTSALVRSLLWKGGIPIVILIIVLFWYWFGSFILWKGRTYWDRFAGTKVTLGPSHSDQ